MSEKIINGYAGFTCEEIAQVRYIARKNLDKRLRKKYYKPTKRKPIV